MTMTDPQAVSQPVERVSAKTRLKWLRDMMLIREFELRTMQAYQEAKIGGFCHVYIGQEACAVGCIAATNPDDPVITAYRDHGHALARGMEARYAMAEMFGKIGGCAKGKGGSMHFFDKRTHFYGGHAIVGGQTPIGAGLAFATRYENEVLGQGKKRVTLCFLGDGALNQGALHEAMNLCAILDLPCIFVVENNRYSMGTSIERGTSMADDLSTKAAAYGMPYFQADGMDVCAVYNVMKRVVDRMRSEQRPAFVEISTYRYKGHSMSDPQKYRTKDEVSEYEANDPIRRLADALIEAGSLNEDGFKELNQSVRDEVRDAIKWAEQSPEPDPATELYSDVVTEPFGAYGPTSLPEMCEHEPGEAPESP
ncbi:MAG: pyruvate dehydrogenase (acetyl-transferring) E1 component subunit alpha [Phycisphaerales bacterium]|nr:pyruvate dehydrogenase (acetyl-transferring) E1 component subunit alpha [Phycisphaerales bacterium]